MPCRRIRKTAKTGYGLRVSLSVRIAQLGSNWTHFREILYRAIFRKSVQKFQLSLKSYRN